MYGNPSYVRHDMRRIGFDLGNTLVHSDTEFLRTGDLALARRIPGAFETVAASIAQNGADNNYIVSMCGVKVQEYSWEWLSEENFFALTGFHKNRYALPRRFELEEVTPSTLENHVLFCEKRPHKAIIAEILGLEAFVDDRIKVLQGMPGRVETCVALQPTPAELALLNPERDKRIVVAQNWFEAHEILGLAA
jgi:hypothetical protein